MPMQQIKSNGKVRRKLLPESITAIIDTRERTPLDISPLKFIEKGLDTGDYSLVGFEHAPHGVAIERKSLSDFIACVGRERERFDRECQRLLAYECKAIVVEATWQQIEQGDYRAKITPQAALGSALGWIAMGIPIIMARDHVSAGRYVSRM